MPSRLSVEHANDALADIFLVAWLGENQPGLVNDLFVPLSPATSAWVTPDNIQAFRAAIDRWVADVG